MKKMLWLLSLLLPALAHAGLPEQLRLPPGFRAELVAQVPGARSLALGERSLFVGTQRGGDVYAIDDPFGGAPVVRRLATGLKLPNGVAFRAGTLYVAEQTRLLAIDEAERRSGPAAEPRVITELPFKNFLHSWKYLAFGPDGLLYVTIGAPCNVCDEPGFGVILRMKPDGSAREEVARGVRNSVGLDWHPLTGELWFTDNGRDMLGDEAPPCELNRAARTGLHFGFPFCHGATIADPDLGKLGQCAAAVVPARLLGPHVAPLGMRFYTGAMFPARYRHQVFIAEHGSWNRSKAAGKTGYRLTLVSFHAGGEPTYEPFMEGFLDGDNVLGRPVDVIVAPDGALLVSDDAAGAVYRISYRSPS
jgi:glucose/arabinose dehydrogenase